MPRVREAHEMGAGEVPATFWVTVRFWKDGPAVTGEWADDSTARRTWRAWVGIYGSDEKAVIRLAENAGGSERVLMVWERGSAVETGSEGGHRSGS